LPLKQEWRFADELAAMRGYKDERAGRSYDLIDALYLKKTLKAPESASALALIDELITSGFYREVLKLEVYKVSGQTKVFDQAATEYNDNSRLFAASCWFNVDIGCFRFVGIIVPAVQLFNYASFRRKFPVKLGPRSLWFAKVYGVLIGWLALESFLSPVISLLIPYLG
jgi:hypothetical protein